MTRLMWIWILAMIIAFVVMRWLRSSRPQPARMGLPEHLSPEAKNVLAWVCQQVAADLGFRAEDNQAALTRIAQAVNEVEAGLRRTGQTQVIDLPFLTADAQGPRHFRMEVSARQWQQAQTEGSARSA